MIIKGVVFKVRCLSEVIYASLFPGIGDQYKSRTRIFGAGLLRRVEWQEERHPKPILKRNRPGFSRIRSAEQERGEYEKGTGRTVS